MKLVHTVAAESLFLVPKNIYLTNVLFTLTQKILWFKNVFSLSFIASQNPTIIIMLF